MKVFQWYQVIHSKITKRVQIVFAIIILILVITNPSNEEYENFLRVNRYEIETYYSSYSYYYRGTYEREKFIPLYGKSRNFLIFSTFQYYDGINTTKYHIGILSNFFSNRIYY